MKMDAMSHVVHVSIPASVAADISSLKDGVKSVLGRLGCGACCSGHDIFFEVVRDRTLRAGVNRVADAKRAAFAPSKAVRIGLNPEFGANIENVFGAIDKIADLSGHSACATGCDIFMQNQRILVLDARAQVEERMLSFG